MSTTQTIVHKFESAGLGIAPFRFVRVEVRKYQACQGAPIQPGGCCAYCGEGIMECCIIRDANGQEFIVGNVCVGKTGDAGLVNLVKRAVNRLKTQQRHAREMQVIAAAKLELEKPEVQAALIALAHPIAWQAEKGGNRLTWAQWMMDHAGNAGKVSVAKFINALGVK